MGLKGSKSIFTRFSFPSSVRMVPQYSSNPFSGILLYSFSFCCVDVMAPSTDNLKEQIGRVYVIKGVLSDSITGINSYMTASPYPLIFQFHVSLFFTIRTY